MIFRVSARYTDLCYPRGVPQKPKRPGRKRLPGAPRYTSAAHELLRLAYDNGILKQREASERLQISQQYLSSIVRGVKTPGPALRERFALPPFGVDARLWQSPRAALRDPAEIREDPPTGIDLTRVNTAAHDPGSINPGADLIPLGVDFDAAGAALAELKSLAARQRQACLDSADPMQGIDATARSKLEAEYRRSLIDLAKLSHELGPADESKLTQTATFLALTDKLRDALRPFPAARQAVIEALDLEDGDGNPD